MNKSANQIRIISGQWRGRKIHFPDRPGLRPTSDRIRETLFNWLIPYTGGADCLDLFAGSGALGFEAASRGASRVVIVEKTREVYNSLKATKNMLSADAVSVIFDDALSWLKINNETFNIIFLDPPFDSDLLISASQLILETRSLKAGGLLYIEARSDMDLSLFAGWQIVKSSAAGQVQYALLTAKEIPCTNE
ncbi:MAG: 16S rRNA (guanine(966)-N(2))-methyltransferase RsmD [Gammaproteobacteria bacterium]